MNNLRIMVNRRDFISAANTAAKAVDKKSAAITKFVMMKAYDGTLEITGYNLNIGIVTTISAAVATAGGICINAEKVAAFLSKCTAENVDLQVSDTHDLTIKCGKAKATVSGVSIADYPKLPNITSNTNCNIHASQLAKIIDNTLYCVADTSTKQVLCGMLIDVKDGKITAVGCDGFRVSEMVVEKVSTGTATAIIPKDAAKILKSLCGNINIQIGESMAKFASEDCVVYTRTVNGEYVNYAKLLSRVEHKQNFEVDANKLLSLIERVAAVGDDIQRPICVKLGADALTVVYESANTVYTEDVEIKLNGEPTEIGMNIKFISEALKNAGRVNIAADGARGGIIITEKNKRQMLMPMRIK